MPQEHVPFSPRPRTSEGLDFHIARAREERAKAMAAFGGQIAAALHALVNRLVRCVHRPRQRDRGICHVTGAPTA